MKVYEGNVKNEGKACAGEIKIQTSGSDKDIPSNSSKKILWNIFRKFYIVLLDVEREALHYAKY